MVEPEARSRSWISSTRDLVGPKRASRTIETPAPTKLYSGVWVSSVPTIPYKAGDAASPSRMNERARNELAIDSAELRSIGSGGARQRLVDQISPPMQPAVPTPMRIHPQACREVVRRKWKRSRS